MKSSYPEQGALIWMDAEPHAGHEMGGHDPKRGNIQRPYVVLSNTAYNQSTDYVIVFPITSKNKDNRQLYYPIIDVDSKINGSVVLFQLNGHDFAARHGKIVGKVSDKVLSDLLQAKDNLF